MPDDWIAWAGADRGWMQLEAIEEAAAFTDYWHAKAGANALKLDWQATWRNWCRNAAGRTYKATPIKPSKHDLSTMNYDKGVDHEGRF